jgi:RHS repeat-associated protein
MKHLLKNTKRIFLFLLIIVVKFSQAQTWSSNPALNTYAACGGSTSYSCSFGTVLGNGVIKARVTSLNSTSATIQITKCSGTFAAGGTGFVKSAICNTSGLGGSTAYAAGASTVSITFNHGVLAGQSLTVYPTISSSTAGNYYYAEPITITASCTTPTNVYSSNLTHGSFIAHWDAMPGATSYDVQYAVDVNNYPTSPQINVTTNSTTITNNIKGCENYKFQVRANYGSCSSSFSNNSTLTTNIYPTPTGVVIGNISSNSATVNWNTITNGYAGYEVKDCSGSISYGTSNISSNVLTSLTPNTTYSVKIFAKNQLSATCYSAPTSCYTFTTLNVVPPSPTNLTAAIQNTNDINLNWQQQFSTATYFKIYRSNTGSSGTYSLIYTTPNQATGYTNTGLSSGTYYYKIEACNSVGCSGFSNTSNSITISTSASNCIIWTNPPTSSNSLTSAEFLCNQGIIISTQNGTTNSATNIKRKDLARIIYLGLYGTNNPNLPSDSLPTPFGDMQNGTAVNSYWYKAVKALSHLEFGDGISPFGRNFINFRPNDGIERQYALKVFLEAFNIAPNNSATHSISDIAAAVSDMQGYIKVANNLGIIANGTFSPTLKITREEAFVILWKMLTLSAVNKPTNTQLLSSSSYFISNNITQSNINKVLGMEQANFNHYEKTSFVLPGKGLPLEFTHRYSSVLTDLPEDFFKVTNAPYITNQFQNTLGEGWTHNYNQYIIYEPMQIDTLGSVYDTTGAKYYIFWGDGSMEVYDSTKGKYETKGTYHTFNRVGNDIFITDKSKMIYQFTTTNLNNRVYNITNIKDRNNNQLIFAYEAAIGANSRRLKTVTDNTTSRFITFNYQTINNLSYIQSVQESGLNRSISFLVNANGDLQSFTDPKSQQSTYAYNVLGNTGKHLLTDITLPKGNTIKADYAGRKLTAVKTINAGNVTSSSTVNWTPTYSASQGSSESSVVDATTPALSTNYTHNAQGNPTNVTSPTSTISNITYDVGENVNKPKNMTVQSQSVTMNYDAVGNLLNITKNGITNTFTYTSYNDILTHTDGKGYTTTYGYTNNNLTSITRPSGGGVVNISRNSYGQPTQITNPAGIVTQLGYNAFGNLNSIQLPLGITTGSTYDNASRLKTKTDAVNNTTTYDYDNNDNVWKITDALNGITELGYDPNDNNTSIKNAKNETATKTYTIAEDLLQTETFGPHSKSYTYYPDGKINTHTKGNGTYTYTYDPQGRLSSDGYTSYTYDSRSNIATIVNNNGTLNLYYDINDRLDYYTDYYGNTVQYTYDNNHNVASIKYPGNKVVNYSYDANNRCTQVSDWLSQLTKFYYLIDDRIDSVKHSNGTSTKYFYDAAGRNTGMNNRKANGTIINEYTYNLNNAGNHLSETMNEPLLNIGLNTLASGTTNYNAMPYNRIQNAGATTFTHTPQGQISNRGTDAYTFDINDNLLTVAGSATATFSYDGAGNRRSKTLNGTTTRYVLSILGMSQVLMETNASNTPTNYYVFGPTGLISRIKPNNTTHVYHYDYRGSTIAMTNASQNATHTYSYDPFGNILSANEPANDLNVFRYVGQQGVQYETPTLTFMRARYADLTTGRFISEDPIWSVNLYPYADNNPVMKVDPNGELARWSQRRANSNLMDLRTQMRNNGDDVNGYYYLYISDIVQNHNENFGLNVEELITEYYIKHQKDINYGQEAEAERKLYYCPEGDCYDPRKNEHYKNYIKMLKFKNSYKEKNRDSALYKARFANKFYSIFKSDLIKRISSIHL